MTYRNLLLILLATLITSVLGTHISGARPSSPQMDKLKAKKDAGVEIKYQTVAGRKVIAGTVGPALGNACDDQSFKDAINSYGYHDRGTPDFRLKQHPENSSYFKSYEYCVGPSYAEICDDNFYRYTVGGNEGSQWLKVDRYVTRVAVCALGIRPNYPSLPNNPDPPRAYPIVTILYRQPGKPWRSAASRVFYPSDIGSVISWHFYTGEDWDWRTTIERARAGDEFDIGQAVRDCPEGGCKPPQRTRP